MNEFKLDTKKVILNNYSNKIYLSTFFFLDNFFEIFK